MVAPGFKPPHNAEAEANRLADHLLRETSKHHPAVAMLALMGALCNVIIHTSASKRLIPVTMHTCLEWIRTQTRKMADQRRD